MDHYDGWLYFMMDVISSMMDVISFMMDGCIMYVMVSLPLLHLYHEPKEDDVFLHMYILLSLSYPMTCTVDD